MKLRLSVLAALLFLFVVAVPCFALSSGGQRTVEMLVRGGPESQRDAAQSLYNNIERNPEVLDVVAEVLLQTYQRPGFIQTDSTAWLCKALGGSSSPRYRSVLREVADKASERKVRKYASQSLEMLPQGEAEQYRLGMVDLAKIRDGVTKDYQRPAVNSKAGPPPPGKGGGDAAFDHITIGMSMEEVFDRIGQPTATTSRITGKAWAPFYHGGDTTRMFALYKGKGRIIFSNTSRYAPVWRVIEVVSDPSESGYP